MKNDIIIMNRKELKRLYLIKKVLAKEVSWGGAAAKLLELSVRQVGCVFRSIWPPIPMKLATPILCLWITSFLIYSKNSFIIEQ